MSTPSTPQTEKPPRSDGDGRAIPAAIATLVGLLASAAALGAGHLLAGFIAPQSSPFVAVGDGFIRITPPFLLEFAKSTFGLNDKLVLNIGMGAIIALVAVVAGLVSRRSSRPGRAIFMVLGLVGLLAALTSPVFELLGMIAPLGALVAGVGVFGWLHGLALDAAGGSAGEPGRDAADRGGLSRRRLLMSTAVTAVGAAVAGAVGQLRFGSGGIEDSRQAIGALRPATPVPAVPAGADFASLGTPTFITPNADFYRIDTANLLIPRTAAESWSMSIHGMVDRELKLTYADLMNRPLVEKTITLTCVSNEIGGELISTSNFVGVPLRDLLMEAGVQPGATQIFTTSEDGWTCGTPTDVVMEPDRGALLAIGMNGEPLPLEHGFPVRMVVPGLYGFVSATKWLADMELTTFEAAQSYWLKRGWGEKAPIKTQSRIDKPKPFERVDVGKVTVAGVAWSQHRGIDRVEVRADDGPWVVAELATEVSTDTWRMWRADLELGAGSHTLQCRSTDRTGATQPVERVDPIPDGATGWHSVIMTAA